MDRDEVSFGRFRLDLGQRKLSRAGMPVRLGSRALDILCVLASAKGEVVSKDELMARVWTGLVVEENNIQVHVSALRKTLDEEKSGESYLVTVPGRGYRLIGLQADSSRPDEIKPRKDLPLPDKPSIAVLPFQNMSGDPEQEYFSDGITEDIITELSRFSELFVIARNSSFQYKGKPNDVRRVGRELGVHYVLEGSIRRSSDRIRISAQLVDTTSGTHRWAERYDRELRDIFSLQDEVARIIVSLLVAHVNKAEIERSLIKPPATWQAYDYYMRAASTAAMYFTLFRAQELYETRRLLEQSISIDPNYARAYAKLSWSYLTAWLMPLDADHLSSAALDQAYELARKAIQLDPNLPEAYAELGYVIIRKREYEAAVNAFEKAISLNPNYTDWRFAGVLVNAGEFARAVEVVEAHMRLDPFYIPLAPMWLGVAKYMLTRYSEALPRLRECIARSPNQQFGHAWLAATCAQLGLLDEARAEAAEVLRINPKYTIEGTQKRVSPFRRPEDIEHYVDGMRKAGLPEK